MADIELVIKVDEEILQDLYDGRYVSQHIKEALRCGKPLPKGHGDLIDRNSVDDFLLPRQDSDAEWCATGETIKRLIRDAFKKAPTIIEADTPRLEVINTSKTITVPVYNCELEEYEEVRMTIKEFLENCAAKESED